jgi:N-acetylmuramoyl-L-alanine amidase
MMTPEEILASTLWSEDRSGGVEGMEPIAGVILNRVDEPGWWGKDVVGVCLAPGQFSCWSWHDPNFRKLLTADESDPEYALALVLARTALRGDPINRANGATHYHARSVAVAPKWVSNQMPCFETPHHLFYKLGGEHTNS